MLLHSQGMGEREDLWILSLRSTNPILRVLGHDHVHTPAKGTASSCHLLEGKGFSPRVSLL